MILFLQKEVYKVLNSTLLIVDGLRVWVDENIRVPSAKKAALDQIDKLEASIYQTYDVSMIVLQIVPL